MDEWVIYDRDLTAEELQELVKRCPVAPSLEYQLGSRTVTYNWPCRIGVSFNCDC